MIPVAVIQTKYHAHLENLISEHGRISAELELYAVQAALPTPFGKHSSGNSEKQFKRLGILNREIMHFLKIVREENLKTEKKKIMKTPARRLFSEVENKAYREAIALGRLFIGMMFRRSKTKPKVHPQMRCLQAQLAEKEFVRSTQ